MWANQPLNACAALLDARVKRLGSDRVALIVVRGEERDVWTYGELLSRDTRTAAGLAALGVWPADRMLLRMPEAALAQTGGLAAAGELTFMLNDTEAAAVMCSSADASEVEKVLPDTPDVFEPWPTMPLDASGIYYTGGATGLPKAACTRTPPRWRSPT